jgi:serine/threonine protein kinase
MSVQDNSQREDLSEYQQAIHDAMTELTFLEESSKLPRERDIPQIRWPDIELQDILGFGGFSQVNLALVKSPEVPHGYYALKCLDEKFLKTRDKKRVIEASLDIAIECDILSRLDHENVIRLHGTSVTNLVTAEFNDKAIRDYFILLDVLEETLLDRLQTWRRQTFFHSLLCRRCSLDKEDMVQRIEAAAIGVARGMKYIHEKQVVLRDLKPENIGFDKNGVPKLFDFGKSLWWVVGRTSRSVS